MLADFRWPLSLDQAEMENDIKFDGFCFDKGIHMHNIHSTILPSTLLFKLAQKLNY